MSLPDDEVDNEVVDAEIVDDQPWTDIVDLAARHHDIEDAEVVDAASSPAESLTFPRCTPGRSAHPR